MGKSRRIKNLVFALLMIVVSFFAFTGKVSAIWTTCSAEGAPKVHLFIDGQEVNYGDPGTQRLMGSISSASYQPCYLMEINQGYRDYDIGWRDDEKQWIWTDASGQRGLIYWYDNPEFEGEPITHFRLPRDKDKTFNLYGKMGKIITIYINGHKKYVVAGREYTPYTLDPDYYVEAGYTDEFSNDRNFTGDSNYFTVIDPEFYEESHKDKQIEYYRDTTKKNSDGNARSTIVPEKGTIVNTVYPDLLPFIDPNTCETVTSKVGSFVNCIIADPKTGVGITEEAAREYYGGWTNYRYQGVQETYELPKYYKYIGFIDQNGNFYDPIFEMKEEYAGYNFTPIVESQMSCSTVYVARSAVGINAPYGLNISEQGARLDEDFNSDYYSHIWRVWYSWDTDLGKVTTRPEYFNDDRISPSISTCTPNETNMTILYSGLKKPDTEYAVVLEGTDGIKVKKGSNYTLPIEGKPKAAEVKTVTLKYQDGITPDDTYSYTKTYTPNGFKIDGVHYEFGQTIVINKDTYIYYDYEENVEGPDLPTPTREHYNFKGWFDASMGGRIITNPRNLTASVYYAQWTGKDKVTVIRTDNISIELDKGSQYTIEEIPYKSEDIIARVAFNYNDPQGTKKVSQVTKYYDKNGATIEGTNEHYNTGDIIVVNQDIRLIANYNERIKPATFPLEPERDNYTFLGWFDEIEEGQEYTEYSGDQDLALFAHWSGDDTVVRITYADGACEGEGGYLCSLRALIDTVEKNSTYSLKYNKEWVSEYDNTFKYEDGVTEDYIVHVRELQLANGWFIDGVHYDQGETIVADRDMNPIDDYIITKSSDPYPETPTRSGYTFVGWFDEDGTQYTNFDDLVNVTLYAHWEESDTVTVTTPYETVSIPRGSEYVLPEYVQKDDEIEATVTLKFQDGLTRDKTKYVYKQFLPLDWMINGVHTYDGTVYYEGDTIIVNEDIVVTPYYLEEIIDAELLPATRDDYNFVGWYNDPESGDRYYSYGNNSIYYVEGKAHVDDITLYAHWKEKGEEDILCKRATTLHTETCTSTGLCSAESWNFGYAPGDTITYGQLGRAGKLVPGDAYTCDVNGDGVFDEETERFYYVSDYYVTTEDEFDNTYATLVYYKNVFYGDNPFVWRPGKEYYYVSAYSCGANWEVGTKCSGYGDLIGPTVAMQYLPSTEDWPNTSLYFATREYNVGSGRTIDYSGKAARLLTAQEASNGPTVSRKYFDEYLFENTDFDRLTNYAEPDNTNYDYWLESAYKNTDIPRAWTLTTGNFVDWLNGVRPAIDVPKYRMEIGDPIMHVITFPDGSTDTIEDGETYIFETNNSTKEDDVIATVTFKPQNNDSDIVRYVTKSYEASGWKVDNQHYNDGDGLVVTKDITLYYDYVETIIPVEFPEDPTREDYIFGGWYDSPAGGNVYTSYSDEYDINLFAHWNSGPNPGPDPSDIVCRRATTLHQKECETTSGYLQPFCNSAANGYGENGSQGTRTITYGNLGISGELHSGDAFDCDVNGDGIYDAETERFYYVSDYYDTNTKEFNNEYAALIYDSNMFNDERTINGGKLAYNTTPANKSVVKGPTVAATALPSAELWNNISLKDTTRQILTNSNNNYLPLSGTEDTALIERFSYEGYAARMLTIQELKVNCSNVRNCNFFGENTQFDTTGALGFWLESLKDTTLSSTVYPLVVYGGSSISDSYKTTDDGYFGIRPVIDVPKENMEIDIAPREYIITYPNGYTEKVIEGTEWTFPTNNSTKNDEIFTVTFKYHNELEDTTSNVIAQYTANGWKIDEDHYNDGDVITVNHDITLEYDYIETTIPAEFPSFDYNSDEYIFEGWFTAAAGGNKVTSYDKPEDITLHAHWSEVNPSPPELYNLGFNTGTKPDEIISTVTFKYHNDSPDTTGNVIRYYVPNGWLVDGERYPNNTYIIKTSKTVIEPCFDDFIKPVSFPTNPTKQGYEFVGWFTSDSSGEQVTVYKGTQDITLHAQYTNNYALLITGRNFYSKVSSLISSYTYSAPGLTFRKANQNEYDSVSSSLTSNNIISLDDSPNEVYMWLSGTDILYYSTADVIYMNSNSSRMFDGLNKIGAIDLSGFNSSKVTDMWKMFNNCTRLTSLNLGNFDTSNVKDMSYMFYSCRALTGLGLSNFNTSNVTNMTYMFYGCEKLTGLDLSNFDTSKVTNMGYMFYNCKVLSSLDVSNFDTSKVTNLSYMFYNCQILTNIDVSSFDTSNVTTMDSMFYACKKLASLDLSSFNTSKVTDMSAMFYDCESLTSLDVSHFDTSKVTEMDLMFTSCLIVPTLDLSSFDTSSVTKMGSMFFNCFELETIYVSERWNVDSVTTSTNMFSSTTKIVGQKGTTYDRNHIDKTYAIIDDAPEHPGYLTYKSVLPPAPAAYTITYPDGYIEIVSEGTEWIFPDLPESSDESATVTFDYNYEGTTPYVAEIHKGNIYNAWLIDVENGNSYNAGDTYIVNSDIVLSYDMEENTGSVEFPEDPTRDGFNFKGWYDVSGAGGNKYTSYDKVEDITLYAKWEPINHASDILCKKYPNWNETSHSLDEIRTGDAFICDVNDDGRYDIDDEMFYYVSDYYDTKTKEFDDSYSVLIRNYNMDGSYTETSIEGALDTCYSGDAYWTNESCNDVYNGPDNAILYLPTTSDWSNVSLYHTERDILTVNGENTYNGHTLPEDFSYDGYAARFLTSQEIARGCNVNITSSNYDRVYLYDIGCGFLTDHLEDAIGEGYTVYRNYYLENPIDGSSKTYLPLMIDSGALTNSIMDNGGVGVRPAIDVPKERIEGYAEEYYSITYPDGEIEYVKPGTVFTFPFRGESSTEILATVTFKYQNGMDDYVSYISNTGLQGWKIGNTHYAASDTLVVNSNIVLAYDDITTSTSVEFPEDPTYEGFTFVGWFDEEGTEYTSYNEEEDITLYAHWDLDINPDDTITLPENNQPKDDDIYTVTLKYQNGDPDSELHVTVSYTPNGWLVNGTPREAGYVVHNASTATIERNYNKEVSGVDLPELERDGSTFLGWYDSPAGGDRYTSYNKDADITLYARWSGGVVPIPENLLCKRATTLHTNTCGNSNCINDVVDGVLTYGNLGQNGILTPGDAFDCDVNGDGYFDEYDERFYYVSDYFDTHTKEFDNSYAALIYSHSVLNGEIYDGSNILIGYNDGNFYEGPTIMATHLPTTEIWSNITLKETTRSILSNLSQSNDPHEFSYSGYAARLLTIQEIYNSTSVSSNTMHNAAPYINPRTYLYENSSYDLPIDSYLTNVSLETFSNDQNTWDYSVYGGVLVIRPDSEYRGFAIQTPYNREFGSARPVIDVPKDKIEGSGYPTQYTITYPDGSTEVVPAGTEFKFPSNVPTKADETVAEVTFKPENGTDNIVRYVTKTYSNPGWMIEDTRYEIGNTYIVNSDITLAYDYIETTVGVVFPEDPVLEGDIFLGWYDARQPEGELVLSYNGDADITFYAHWQNGGIPTTDALCRRAKYLHTDICEWNRNAGSYLDRLGCGYSGQPYRLGDTIYYGNLGENGVLTKYDAFTCDVNGDGIFDEETERFYYISDYYNTRTDSFEDDTAVLLYYTNREDGVDYQHNVLYDNEYGWNGPIGLLPYLPTTEEWSNVSLKESVRQLTTNTGQRAGYYYNGNTRVDYELGEIDYGNSAARIPTAKEIGDYNDWEATIVENTWYNKRLGNHYSYATESIYPSGENSYSYDVVASNQMMWQSSTKGSTSNSWGIRPVIDVPKDKIDLSTWDRYNVSIDDEVVEEVVKNEEYTVPVNTKSKEDEDAATVTFVVDGEIISTSKVQSSYIPNGYKLGTEHYDAGDKILVNEDINLVSDYITTFTPAEFPENPTKAYYTFDGWYDSYDTEYTAYDGTSDVTLYAKFTPTNGTCFVTYDNGEVQSFACGDKLSVPSVYQRTDRFLTFDYNDGTTPSTTIRYFKQDYVKNFEVDGTEYRSGDEITVDTDLFVTRNYNSTRYFGDFPEVTTEGFIGWFSERTNGDMYRDYKEYREANIDTTTLYAHYEQPFKASVIIDGKEVAVVNIGETFTFPSGTDVDKDIATVTFVNGTESTTSKVHETKTFDHYDVDGTSYNAGSTIEVTSTVYAYSQYTNEVITPVTISDLEDMDTAYFVGWFDERYGHGVKYTDSYDGRVDLTLYAHFEGKVAIEAYFNPNFDHYILKKEYSYGEEVDTSDIVVTWGEYSGNGMIHYFYNDGTDNNYYDYISYKHPVDHWIDDEGKEYGLVHIIDFSGEKNLYAVLSSDFVIDYDVPELHSSDRPGYDFVGWFTAPEGGTRITKITEDKDYDLYAHWKKNDDPICTFSTGEVEECYEGQTYTVPSTREEFVSNIYQIINAPHYEKVIWSQPIVYRERVVEYYEIGGTRYYPGQEYTIEDDRYIEVKYNSSYIEPIILDEMPQDEVNYYLGDEEHVFAGWYTDRTGGTLITSYDGEDDLFVYAHYASKNETLYRVTIKKLDGTETTNYVPAGTKIVLNDSKDEFYQFDLVLNYDDDSEPSVTTTEYVKIHYHGSQFSINADWGVGRANQEIIVDQDLTIETVASGLTDSISPTITTPSVEGYVFSGWMGPNGDIIDFDTINVFQLAKLDGSTVYGYLMPKGVDDVTIDFDGLIYAVPRGTTLPLPDDGMKQNDSFYITLESLRNGSTDIEVNRYYNLTHYLVNGAIVQPETDYTFNEDTVIRSQYEISYDYEDGELTYPELPTLQDTDFIGWYDSLEGGNLVSDASSITEETTLYARYTPKYKLDVDGDISYVPAGYVYTVPESIAVDNPKSITFTLSYGYDDIFQDVTISYAKGISYQTINGTRYNVNDTYVVNSDTTVVTTASNENRVIMTPEIPEPTRDGYTFVAWGDGTMEEIDIYSITPDDIYYNGMTMFAIWSTNRPNTVKLTLVDEYRRYRYTISYDKGYVKTLSEGEETNTINSVITNNINDDVINMTITAEAPIDHYLVNGVRYEPGSTYTVNEDTIVEVIRDVTVTRTCDGGECPSIIYQEPDTIYGEYLFKGIYAYDNSLVDITKIVPRGLYNDGSFESLEMRFESLEDSVILTVDGEVSIIPKGMGTIPAAKTKASDIYTVRYDYNDGTNKVTTDNITVSYEFKDYYVEGKGSYEAGAAYNYLENTTMNSTYTKSVHYNKMPTIRTENFLGWFTEPHGGEQVTSLEGIERNITLYARYNNDHVTIYIDNVPNQVLYGDEFTLPDSKTKSDDVINITLDYGYDNITSDLTITTSYEFDSYEMDNNNYDPGYTFEATEDKFVTSKYNKETTINPAYSKPEREGYIFGGWLDENDNVIDVANLTAESTDLDGKTLTASWTEITPDSVVVTYDGTEMVVPIGTKLSELGDSPIKPANETFTVYIDRNNSTFIVDEYNITKSYTLDKVMINGEELTEDDYTFNEDTTVNTTYTASYSEDIFDLPQGVSGLYTLPVDGDRVESYDDVNDGDTLYYHYTLTHTITIDGEVAAVVEHGKEYTIPVNNKAKAMDNIATVTFDYADGRDNTYAYVRTRYNANGWSINGEEHANNEVITVNEDIVLDREYYETIQGIDFPRTPKRTGYRFDAWYLGDDVITSYDGTEDVTLTARWIKQLVITNMVDDTVYVVDEGYSEVLGSRDDKEEKFYNITFKYNYENSPADKVVRISTQDKFIGWTANNDEYGIDDEITYTVNTTLRGRYEEIINNKNLPSDPTRDGYTFLGWYTAATDGELIDITTIDTNKTVYAHWENFDPETQVKVIWDGVPEIYDKGTTVSLDRTEGKEKTERVATITFIMNNDNYDNMTVYVDKKLTRDHYEINGEDHIATGDYTFYENTIIDSVYSENITYPKLPIISDNTFKGFFTSYEGGSEVTTLEGITRDSTFYAHWEEEMIPVTFDGETTEYPKGTEITLPNGKAKDSKSIDITLDYGNSTKDVTITTSYTFDDYSVNGASYQANDKYVVNTPTVIISRYSSETTNNFTGYDNNNFDLGYVTSDGTLVAWLDSNNSEFDLNTLTGESEDYDNYTFTASYDNDIPSTINVTIDSMDPYSQETGKHMLIPQDKELTLDVPSDEEFTITFNNNGETSTVTGTKEYVFSHFSVDGVGEYQRNDDYTFYKDTVITSNYTNEYSYDGDIPTVSDELFIGWFTQTEGGSEVTTLEGITTNTTLYARYRNANEYTVYFDGKAYVYDDTVTSVTPINEGYAPNELNRSVTLNLLYQDNRYQDKSMSYDVISLHMGWTDENDNAYNETIDLTNIEDGTRFTSIYVEDLFNLVDLSSYNPEDNTFLGWYTERDGGEKVTTYNGEGDATYFAHWTTPDQAIVTIDGDVEIYNIGDTLTLPEAKTRADSAITVTFDPTNGEDTFTRSKTTTYTFNGYKYEKDNVSYEAGHEFEVTEDMTFSSDFTENTTADEWPEDPVRENYFFLNWYTARDAGIEVFGFDDISSSTTLYAHWTTNPENFVRLTNTATGESISVLSGSDWLFNESKFNKDLREKLGTITYKFNAPGYPDEVKDYYRTSTPSGYYVDGDTSTLIGIDEAHQFTSDANITPYYDDNDIITDTHVGVDQFDYEITNGDKHIRCFSKTAQTDPYDDEEYTCYTEYDENDGNVTVYLHWKELKTIHVTEPDGTINEYTEGDIYNTGENNHSKDPEGYTVTFKYQDGETSDTTQSHMTTYTPNGWLINGNHVADNTDITLEEDLVKEYDYTSSSTIITLPEPTRDDYTFVGWNSRTNGKGTTYDNDSINALDKDTTVYGIWTKDEINISFVTNNGEDIDSIVVPYDTPIGDVLPTLTKDNERRTVNNEDVIIGYIFDGWYREDTFSNKVSTSSTFTEDTILYANWLEDEFPYVYPKHEENFVCTGSNYIDTGVKLFTSNNDDYLKDFEVGFTIESYVPNQQSGKQVTFFNAKWENTAEQWPGVAFRRKDSTANLEFSSSAKKNRVAYDVLNYTLPLEVRIYRVDNEIYLSTDGGATKAAVQSVDGFTQYFDINSYFCAGDDGNGGVQRHVKGTISNYYIRLGDFQGDIDTPETHTVTYPDNSVETYYHNTIIELDANESSKADEIGAAVTFVYNDGVTPSEVRYNTTSFTPNGFIVNNTRHYDDNAELVVDEDKVITYDYNSENDDVEFPEDPTREYYVFDGWYTEGGDKVEYYDGEEAITLYAHWTRETVNIIYPDETITVNKGEEYTLRDNEIAKADDNAATVTFKYHDEETEDLVRYVKYHYTANGWSIDGTPYADGATITPTTDITVIPEYTSENIEVEFPEEPTREDYEFDGWYDAEEDGNKVESYDGENDITLHAHWNMTLPTDFDIDVDNITMMVGETHQIEVTFTPDGTSDTVTYADYDGEKISIADGLVTALAKGETTITVGLEHVPDVTKTITVTIISDKLESEVYDVREEDIDAGKDRVIVGAEPLTTIGEFKDNLLNPNEYVKIYDSEGNELEDDEEIRTGLVIKLEYNGIVVDEAILVLRGDIDGDGVVNISDYMAIINHYVESAEITGYPFFLAADVDEDETVNMADAIKLLNYYTENIDTLND